MSALLSPEEIASRLATLPGWELRGTKITKQYRFADFVAAMAFVNRVADLAEAMNHHPDIAIHYSEVTLTLWSHDAGGLTRRDFTLAADIERLD